VAERVSDPVVIDHTPPELVKTEKDRDGKLRVTVRDAASPLREALFSVNAQEWKPVRAEDGLLDGRTETLLIEPGKPGDLGLLRVTDAAYNVITFNLTQGR
jgi:IMP dehydrogenase/GMP reductase